MTPADRWGARVPQELQRWQAVEIYAAFLRIDGELALGRPERLTDGVNRFGDFVALRQARTEPLLTGHPAFGRPQARVSVNKRSIVLLCPLPRLAHGQVLEPSGVSPSGNVGLWRERERRMMLLTSANLSMAAEVHLEPGMPFEDHYERCQGGFMPITNLSAIWLTPLGIELPRLQRPFALLNTEAIVSYAGPDAN